ncbi:hypothetical protein [Microcystis sp. M42BS1]|uniref:putative amidoligase domain-containing protein n=1 Tax=Microcystis sp. M42BS1 TaxID=2771192 RepID=UPI002586F80B|nr:hypothetical protein [Microcystis sp. M42BS1]MCA2570680.1 hypothetical protein [Microcystis sp. M42BS1]
MYTIGCDPEVFLFDGKKVRSAIDKIGGSKTLPKDYGDGIALQEDNVAVEWTIPPVTNVDDFIRYNTLALQKIEEQARKFNLSVKIVASCTLPKEELIDPRAQEFGCEPDFNAWLREQNPRPKAGNKLLRSAGGHVHIGGIKDVQEKETAVRLMDILAAVPLSYLDKDTRRMQLYGKAGCFRFKPYGVEYRTLSNYWTRSPELMRFVFNAAKTAAEVASDPILAQEVDGIGQYVQAAINDGDQDARNFVMKFGADLRPSCDLIEAEYGKFN